MASLIILKMEDAVMSLKQLLNEKVCAVFCRLWKRFWDSEFGDTLFEGIMGFWPLLIGLFLFWLLNKQ